VGVGDAAEVVEPIFLVGAGVVTVGVVAVVEPPFVIGAAVEVVEAKSEGEAAVVVAVAEPPPHLALALTALSMM
jgi:predicted secreted protein